MSTDGVSIIRFLMDEAEERANNWEISWKRENFVRCLIKTADKKQKLCARLMMHLLHVYLIQSFCFLLFESKNIVKVYECLVQGPLKRSKGTLNYPIGKDRHSQKMRVSSDGEDALTHYEVIGETDTYSRLKVVIETGKKHQIRVHLAHIGYPIIGDTLYHGKTNSRLMLHFKEVEFIHPFTNEKLHLVDQVPF